MIRSVTSDHSTFHDVHFQDGFNVVLADRTQESTRTDSRNGLGKSTLIEIIHFCLGAKATKGKGLLSSRLAGWTFSLDLTTESGAISVSRSTDKPQKVSLLGSLQEWPIKPAFDKASGAESLSISHWTETLGALMFGLPVSSDAENSPSFRGLFSFVSRRTRDAYSLPFETYRKQKEAEKQIYNTFLLGLEWRDAAAFEALKERKLVLEELQRAARHGIVKDLIGSMGELEALRVRLKGRSSTEAQQLVSFRVHEQYEDIVSQADSLTRQLHELANQNIADTRYIELYRATLEKEESPAEKDVVALYEEAGVSLGSLVKERLENVQAFHAQLVENRRTFLASEIDRLEKAVQQRTVSTGALSDTRAALLQILQTHGALSEYNRLHELHNATLTELGDVERRIKNLRDFQEGKSQVAIEQETLFQRSRRDLDERSTVRNEAIRLFNENSEALYSGAAGNLIVDISPQTGFKFSVDIERSGSQGINSMKVFCYDLTLTELWARRSPSPRVLIHDSTIFDGVDERQVAAALELAARKAKAAGFQYICTLNSDTIPWREFSKGFDLNSYVRLRLTDKSDADRLLGIDF